MHDTALPSGFLGTETEVHLILKVYIHLSMDLYGFT